MTELWQKGARELSHLFRLGQASPVEVLQAVRARFESVNPIINAVIAVDWKMALAAARASEKRLMKGECLGPLDGVPLTVKDNLYVAGFPATWGSQLFQDFRPNTDDIPVARLRRAGAILFGKSNTPEFALAAVTDNPVFGKTRNPWNTDLTPGGSSGGGAAAVAAGIGPLALATDAGGSIRRPASYTGLVGLRPSTGRVARAHGFPPLAGDFQVVGPLARTIADAELFFDVIRGAHELDRASLAFANEPLRGSSPRRALKIRYLTPPAGQAVDSPVRQAVTEVATLLAALGHEVEEDSPPYDLVEIEEIWSTLTAVGLARVLQPRGNWRQSVTPSSAAVGERGMTISGTHYLESLDRVSRLRQRMTETLAQTDLLLSATSASLPWPVELPYPETIDGRPAPPRGAAIFATFVNAAGLPALSLPGQPSEEGLPVGVQLVGAFGADALLLGVAGELETALNWPTRWPLCFAPDRGRS